MTELPVTPRPRLNPDCSLWRFGSVARCLGLVLKSPTARIQLRCPTQLSD